MLWLTSSAWGCLLASGPKLDLGQLNRLIKKEFEKTLHFFQCFYCRFWQARKDPLWYWQYFQVDILARSNCNQSGNCKGQVSKLLQNLDNIFSGIQHGAVRTDQKIYSLFFYDFCMVVRIFKIAASLSIFSATGPSLTQQKKQIKSNYKFGQNERQKAHHRFFATTSTPIETIINLMCSSLLFSFLVVYIIQSRLFEM